MNFSDRHDIDAPIEAVFAKLADLACFDAAARARGIDLRHLSGPVQPGPGSAWVIGVPLRGRRVDVEVSVVDTVPPHQVMLSGFAEGMACLAHLELTALAAGRTRMTAQVELRPRTVGARLLVRSAVLARRRLTAGFGRILAELARETEALCRRSGG
ncbi:SRPBCC family protein [Sulfitobacter sp. LCG007]